MVPPKKDQKKEWVVPEHTKRYHINQSHTSKKKYYMQVLAPNKKPPKVGGIRLK
tara:strand:+ start:28 stop:189 length:162 start_codon:yes stop_codon:yes gene_type:complete